jgi:hypothetical protein
MFGEHNYTMEAVRERQMSILEEYRKANSTERKLSFSELFLLFFL